MQGTLTAETYSGKVTGQFDSRPAARKVMQHLCEDGGFAEKQVELVVPHDPKVSRKLEPESKNIARTITRSHLMLGVLGLVAGVVIASLLVTIGPAATQESPVLTFIGVITPTVFLSLMLAGAVSLRPDHDPVIETTKQAAAGDRWSVVVHVKSQQEQERAQQAFKDSLSTL